MTDSTAVLPEAIECPLCLGKGELSRTEVLERLGMKDFTRTAMKGESAQVSEFRPATVLAPAECLA